MAPPISQLREGYGFNPLSSTLLDGDSVDMDLTPETSAFFLALMVSDQTKSATGAWHHHLRGASTHVRPHEGTDFVRPLYIKLLSLEMSHPLRSGIPIS